MGQARPSTTLPMPGRAQSHTQESKVYDFPASAHGGLAGWGTLGSPAAGHSKDGWKDSLDKQYRSSVVRGLYTPGDPESSESAPDVGAAVLAALRLRAGRGPLRTLLDQVRLVVQEGMVHIQCWDGAQVLQVYTHLVPLLPTVLTECRVRARVVVGVRC